MKYSTTIHNYRFCQLETCYTLDKILKIPKFTYCATVKHGQYSREWNRSSKKQGTSQYNRLVLNRERVRMASQLRTQIHYTSWSCTLYGFASRRNVNAEKQDIHTNKCHDSIPLNALVNKTERMLRNDNLVKWTIGYNCLSSFFNSCFRHYVHVVWKPLYFVSSFYSRDTTRNWIQNQYKKSPQNHVHIWASVYLTYI